MQVVVWLLIEIGFVVGCLLDLIFTDVDAWLFVGFFCLILGLLCWFGLCVCVCYVMF